MKASSSLDARVFLLVGLAFGLTAVVVTADWRTPNLHRGYAPEQPIAYSHRLHAGELGIDCLHCHSGARTSRHAGIPPAGLCMNCHSSVSAGFDTLLEERNRAELESREPERVVSDEIERLYAAVGLDTELQPLPDGPEPLEWVRVHNLPDFVAFDHSVHVARDVACQTCHGPVQAMERVRQEQDLSMGWCVSCHRENAADPSLVRRDMTGRLPDDEHVSTDCAACHY
jgi:hypothetical protein